MKSIYPYMIGAAGILLLVFVTYPIWERYTPKRPTENIEEYKRVIDSLTMVIDLDSSKISDLREERKKFLVQVNVQDKRIKELLQKNEQSKKVQDDISRIVDSLGMPEIVSELSKYYKSKGIPETY